MQRIKQHLAKLALLAWLAYVNVWGEYTPPSEDESKHEQPIDWAAIAQNEKDSSRSA